MGFDRTGDGDDRSRPSDRPADSSAVSLPPDPPSPRDRSELVVEVDRYRALVDAEEARYAEAERAQAEQKRPEDGRGWRTITDEIGESKSWHSFNAAKRELGTVPGSELHHIVEQSQSKPERSGFDTRVINSSDNLTRQPVDVHRRISAQYSSLIPGGTETVRDWLTGRSWDDQYKRGCDAIDEAMRRRDADD